MASVCFKEGIDRGNKSSKKKICWKKKGKRKTKKWKIVGRWYKGGEEIAIYLHIDMKSMWACVTRDPGEHLLMWTYIISWFYIIILGFKQTIYNFTMFIVYFLYMLAIFFFNQAFQNIYNFLIWNSFDFRAKNAIVNKLF